MQIDHHTLQNLGWDISFSVEQVRLEFMSAAYEQQRPCVVFKPKIYPDGNMWCVLLGEDIVNGVAGFGETPAKAMHDFDTNFLSRKLPSISPTTPSAE